MTIGCSVYPILGYRQFQVDRLHPFCPCTSANPHFPRHYATFTWNGQCTIVHEPHGLWCLCFKLVPCNDFAIVKVPNTLTAKVWASGALQRNFLICNQNEPLINSMISVVTLTFLVIYGTSRLLCISNNGNVLTNREQVTLTCWTFLQKVNRHHQDHDSIYSTNIAWKLNVTYH